MRIQDLTVGETYEGAYGEPYELLEILGTYEDRRGMYRKAIPQAVRVRHPRWGDSVKSARSLKRVFASHQQETDLQEAEHVRGGEQFAQLLERLEPFGVRGSYQDKATVTKPATLTLSRPAVDHLLRALRDADRGDALADVLDLTD